MIYLNNAATSYPKPPAVLEAMSRAAAEPPKEQGRGGVSGSTAELCRNALAEFFGVVPEQVALLPSATHALNLAIGSFAQAGARVVTTDVEHNSVLRPLAHSEAAVTHVRCGSDGRLDPDTIAQALEHPAALMVMSHVSNVTGIVQPIAAVAELCAGRGIPLLIDAAQSAGVIELPSLPGQVMIAVAGHKNLYGPPGTGALIGELGALEQRTVGGTGVNSEAERHPPEPPRRHEAGTPNSIGLAGWNAGIRWVQERGVAALGACRAQWASRVRDRLPETAAPVPAEVRDEDLRAGIVSVVPKTGSVAEIAYALSEAFDISLRAGLQCAPRMHRALGVDGTLRLSCGAFSTLEDADAAVEALAAVCG